MQRELVLFAAVFLLSGCNPHVTIDQTKPIEININFSGHLDLVIHDARQDMEAITGEKPVNVVRPEDIGLAPATGGAMEPMDPPTLAEATGEERFMPALLKNQYQTAEPRGTFFVAVVDDLKKSMATRDKLVRPMWDAKLVGESHTGLLEIKGTLTAEQQKLVEAENADRKAFFAEEAKAKSVPVDEISLAFYVARLGYAKNGAWFEKKNAAGTWEWKQWGS